MAAVTAVSCRCPSVQLTPMLFKHACVTPTHDYGHQQTTLLKRILENREGLKVRQDTWGCCHTNFVPHDRLCFNWQLRTPPATMLRCCLLHVFCAFGTRGCRGRARSESGLICAAAALSHHLLTADDCNAPPTVRKHLSVCSPSRPPPPHSLTRSLFDDTQQLLKKNRWL